jgi:hypothetical protein
MYTQTCYDYFDLALAQAKFIDAKLWTSPQGDTLKWHITEQGTFEFQIKAPVFPTAAMALMKTLYERGQDWSDLQTLCKILQCPNTHRHQIQWLLQCLNYKKI